MKKMYEEGGLATDGLSSDPVSGNDIPVGSNAEDVRDDVDAKLSEGEYVVPADVVRYFGVGYFEKLRKKAKEALAEMDEDGRVGGEPMPTAEEDMSPEEMAELESVLNMANGGYVQGYADGGSVVDSGALGGMFQERAMKPQTNWMQYSTPGSFQRAGQAPTVAAPIPTAPTGFVEYVGPEGQIMMVPVDAEGNPLIQIPEGYTKKEAVTAQTSNRDDDDSPRVTPRSAEEVDAENRDWFDKFHTSEDPAAMARSLLDETPLGLGGVLGSADTLTDIARIRGYAKAIEETNPDLSTSLIEAVDLKIKDSGLGIKTLEGIVARGDMWADRYTDYLADSTSESTSNIQTPTPDTDEGPARASDTAIRQASSMHDRIANQGSTGYSGNTETLAGRRNIQDRAAQTRAEDSSDRYHEVSAISGESIAEQGRSAAPSSASRSPSQQARDEGDPRGMNRGGIVKPKTTRKKKAPAKPKGKRGLGRK